MNCKWPLLSWLALTTFSAAQPSSTADSAFLCRVHRATRRRIQGEIKGALETKQGHSDNGMAWTSSRESKTTWNPPLQQQQHQQQDRRQNMLQVSRYFLATIFGLSYHQLSTAKAAAFSETSLKLCQTGALMPEQAITGAYEQDCMTLPVREIPYHNIRQNTSVALRIRQGTAGAGSTGLAVWNSSILLSRLLQQLAVAVEDWSTNKRVLELGCGTGLASLTVAGLGAANVLATDGNPAVVALAEQNIRDNGLSDRVQAQLLPWSFMDAVDYADEMDLVMGADLTYQSQNWPALSETMATVVKPRTGLVLYLTLGHAGFAVEAELQGFLSVAQRYGLVSVAEAASMGLPTTDLTRFVYEKCIRPEELPIVQSTGGVRVLALQRKK